MIQENLAEIRASIPNHVKLIAVSKTKPNEDILEAYKCGQRVFGENKVQELCAKYETLPKDIEWHMIGHLQSNKVKYVAPFVSLIHAVDSIKLLNEINKQGAKNKRVIECLLQIHIAEEETKFGFNFDEVIGLLDDGTLKGLPNVRIVGLMAMATNTDDESKIIKEFQSLTDFFNRVKKQYFGEESSFKEISTGMSGDYLLAIESGSTMVRVGSSIFGHR